MHKGTRKRKGKRKQPRDNHGTTKRDNHGTTMGQPRGPPWDNHGTTTGQPRDNPGARHGTTKRDNQAGQPSGTTKRENQAGQPRDNPGTRSGAAAATGGVALHRAVASPVCPGTLAHSFARTSRTTRTRNTISRLGVLKGLTPPTSDIRPSAAT